MRLYMALQTQWQTVALSTWSTAQIIRTGLNYGVIGDVARLEGLEVATSDFRRLRIMEAEALDAWADERRRAAR